MKARSPSDGFAGVLTQVQSAKTPLLPLGGMYTVRPGDTLYRISRQLKGAHNLQQSPDQIVKELTEKNRLSNPNLIFPGQQLRLPFFAGSKSDTSDPETMLLDLETAPLVIEFQTDDFVTGPAAISTGETEIGRQGFPVSMSEWSEPPAEVSPDTPEKPFDLGDQLLDHSNTRILLFQGEDQDSPTGMSDPLVRTEAYEQYSVSSPKNDRLETPLPSSSMSPGKLATQLAMYKEDQLLAHPGGDYFFLNKATGVYQPAFDRSRFENRVGKDLADVGENLINAVKDLAMGSRFKYVGMGGRIEQGQRVGLLGTLRNFFQDLLSGLSFGAYVPAGEKAPERGFAGFLHFIKKVFYDAPVKDLLVGVPHAGIHIGKDVAIAALNLLQVVPDATIGNFEMGQKITTTIFDNGQVVIDYLTDVLPGGNAWMRVHASGGVDGMALPIFYNLQTAEQGITDSRWATVRNTPFRKTVETLGVLLADGVTAMAVTQRIPSTSADEKRR